MAAGLNRRSGSEAAGVVGVAAPMPLGVNTAALAAWEGRVDFFVGWVITLEGVKEGESPLRAFLAASEELLLLLLPPLAWLFLVPSWLKLQP